MSIVANAKEGYLQDLGAKNPKTSEAASMASSLGLATLKTTVDMPMMKGLDNLFGLLYRGGWDRFWPQYFGTVGSIAVPRMGQSLSNIQASWLMDLSSGDTSTAIANQMWKSRVWMFGKYLPLARDYFGRPIPATPEGANPWVYRMVDVRKASATRPDQVDQYVKTMYDRTSDLRFIPSIPDKARWFSWPPEVPEEARKQIVMSDHQYEVLLRYAGALRHNAVSNLISSPRFTSALPEAQAKVLDSAYEQAQTVAHELLVEDMHGVRSPKFMPARAIISRYK